MCVILVPSWPMIRIPAYNMTMPAELCRQFGRETSARNQNIANAGVAAWTSAAVFGHRMSFLSHKPIQETAMVR
jgi:hypothetical protein